MSKRALFAALVCVALPALAQEDDLAPLAPIGKPKPKAPSPLVRAKPKPPGGARPAPVKPKAPVDDDDLAPLSVPKGELVVKVAPPTVSGAVVLVDGKEVGSAPSTQSVAAGEHTVTVKRPGFANFVKKVAVAVGKSVEVDAKMTAVSAVLTISSDVPEAQVFINNRLIGTTPIVEREWPPGTYDLTVRKEGFKEDKQSATLVAGRDSPISVKFKPVATAVATVRVPSDRPIDTSLTPTAYAEEPVSVVAAAPVDTPVYQRWYFWVGVAAVVAAGVGIGVAVNQAGAKPRDLMFNDFKAKNGKYPDSCINVSPCAAGQWRSPEVPGITF
jgi:hypothetical protein